jgi:1,4-dihydroxy-2-naphthoyl-CoA synthase
MTTRPASRGCATPDQKEGMTAFAEKRKPEYKQY